MKVNLLSRVQLLATPWTAAYQAPLSMGFSRQEYWSGVPLLFLLYVLYQKHNLPLGMDFLSKTRSQKLKLLDSFLLLANYEYVQLN